MTSNTDLYADYEKIRYVVNDIRTIATQAVGNAQDAIYAAINQLNHVKGFSEFVGTINASTYDGVFSAITYKINGIAYSIEDKGSQVSNYESALASDVLSDQYAFDGERDIDFEFLNEGKVSTLAKDAFTSANYELLADTNADSTPHGFFSYCSARMKSRDILLRGNSFLEKLSQKKETPTPTPVTAAPVRIATASETLAPVVGDGVNNVMTERVAEISGKFATGVSAIGSAAGYLSNAVVDFTNRQNEVVHKVAGVAGTIAAGVREQNTRAGKVEAPTTTGEKDHVNTGSPQTQSPQTPDGGKKGGGSNDGGKKKKKTNPPTQPASQPQTQPTAPSAPTEPETPRTEPTTPETPRTEPTTPVAPTQPTTPSEPTQPRTEAPTEPATTTPVTRPVGPTTPRTIETSAPTQPTEPEHIGGQYGPEGYKGEEKNVTFSASVGSAAEKLIDDSEKTVDQIIKGTKYGRVPTSSKPILSNRGQGSSTVIPVATGFSAASAAAVGAKAYMDHKHYQQQQDEENYEEPEEIIAEEWVEDADEELDLEEYNEPIQDRNREVDSDYFDHSEGTISARWGEELEEV